MDRSRFTPSSPGELVRAPAPMDDWAFVPAALPPKWEISSDLWPMVADAMEALGMLNGIGQTLPDPQLLLRPLQNREALTSSSLEGTYITPEQLLLYELDPREPHSAEDRMADWKEVHNYNRALIRGCELLKELPLCIRVVKEMHAILLDGARGRNKRPGKFRQWQVQLGSTARFVPPPHPYIDDLMHNLEKYCNEDDGLHPLVRCYIVHYQFETIHPFADGNGRVGRALLALMVYQYLNHSAPWLYMSAYYERFKDEYVGHLFDVSASGNWSQWIEFCLRGTVEQCADAIRRCEQFKTLQREFHDRAATSSSPRTHRIIDELFSSPLVNIPRLARQYDVSYPTAKSDVQRLVDLAVLTELENTHPKVFYSTEIMRIAFREHTAQDSDHPSETQ